MKNFHPFCFRSACRGKGRRDFVKNKFLFEFCSRLKNSQKTQQTVFSSSFYIHWKTKLEHRDCLFALPGNKKAVLLQAPQECGGHAEKSPFHRQARGKYNFRSEFVRLRLPFPPACRGKVNHGTCCALAMTFSPGLSRKRALS